MDKTQNTSTLWISLAVICLVAVLSACQAAPTVTDTPGPTATITNTPPPTPAPTPAPPGSVAVWITSGDKTRLLSHEPDTAFQAVAAETDNMIIVNADERFQQMEGFGASMTDSSAWLLMKVLDEPARLEVMKKLFTLEKDGIRLSYLRIPMGASDFARRDYTYNDLPAGQTDPNMEHFSIEYDKAYILPSLRLASQLNPDLRLMGSPWSAPPWMKSTRSIHGGELLPEYYQAFANYHVAFIQAYAAEGIRIDAITPQNEPLYSSNTYPTMSINLEGMKQLVSNYLGPALQNAGLDTRLVVFDHNWDLIDYPLGLMEDPEVAKYVDGVAFHCYGGAYLAQTRFHNKYPGVPVWHTECSGGGWEGQNFAVNLVNNATSLLTGNIRNWGNSVILWNLALDENNGPTNGGCTNCRGVVTINQQTGEVAYTEDYYLLGHISRFVDPGAYRIDTTKTMVNTPENVAFLNPDGSVVLIVVSKVSRPVTVVFNDYTFTYAVPDKSLITFKWMAQAAP